MNKIILITGASSGFGKATAELFAANGWNCIITARSKEKIDALANELTQRHSVQVLPLVFDVQDKAAVDQQIGSLPDSWKKIDVLVNNAGLALGRDPFDQADMEDWEIMIDTNLKGLLYVTRALLPLMQTEKKGHIINIGSTAGVEVYKDGNVYCATKHAVDAISKAMRIDLLSHGIKVTVVHPGAAETQFSVVRFKGNEQKAAAVYDGYQPLKGEDIADIIYYAATLPDHVCINELVVTCKAQANSFYLHK
jgi:NADP-dependent 3-hydroxy acid dehydrogenase YdfG